MGGNNLSPASWFAFIGENIELDTGPRYSPFRCQPGVLCNSWESSRSPYIYRSDYVSVTMCSVYVAEVTLAV